MAKSSIKVRAKAAKGTATIKALMKHPMESGNRKDKKTGKKIPEDFIQIVNVEIAGKPVMLARLSGAVSKNPYLSLKAPGNKGDDIKISWYSSVGATESVEAKIK